MNRNGLRFHVERRLYADRFALYVAEFRDGIRSHMKHCTFERVENELMLSPEPPINLLPEEAQELMDELYLAGIRPSEEGGAGQLQAIKYHLEDMRKLVFKNDK